MEKYRCSGWERLQGPLAWLVAGWKICLVSLLGMVLVGCEAKATSSPTISKPSLEASSSKERLDAVKEAGEKFGAKP